jgi:hypothetical protein
MRRLEGKVLKVKLNAVSLTCVLGFFFGAAFSATFSQAKTPSVKEIQSLINEMTTTPVRQQKALDELSKYDNEILIYLFPYLEDERSIATENVKFLNPYPRAFEKYFMTSAQKVDEIVVQFFCWRTARCAPSSEEVNSIEKAKRQLESDFKVCRSRDSISISLCRDKLGIRRSSQ